MEPIRLWRWFGALKWRNRRGLPSDIEYTALPRAEFDALVRERERANQNVIESLAIARKALEENDRAEAVLIDKAGVDGDDLSACCEALLVQRDAATARAEKAEALLRELRGWLNINERAGREAEVGCPTLLARIDALLRGTGAP